LLFALKQKAAHWGKHIVVHESDADTGFFITKRTHTGLFHAHATQRMRRNQIRGVEVDGHTMPARLKL
jgi:hypothetical protein